MKLRPLRFILRSLLTVVVPVLCIYILVATNTGLQSLAWLAQHFTPGLEKIEIQGRLIGPLYIQDLDYRHETISFQLKQAMLDWQPQALLKGNIIIENIQANDLTINVLNNVNDKKKKKDNLNWLKRLYIKHIDLKNITLNPSNLKLQINGSLTNQWNIQWQAQLKKITQTAVVAIENPADKAAQNKLELALQSLTGNIVANGAIQGDKLQPQIFAIINAEDLTLEKLKAKKLQLNVATDLTPRMNSILTLNATQLSYQDYLFSTAFLQAQGQINPVLTLSWKLNAKLKPDKNYSGSINAQGNINGNYKAPTITATINAQQVKLKTIKINNLTAQLTAGLDEQAQIAQLQLKLDGLKVKDYQFAPVQLKAVFNSVQQLLMLQLAPGSLRYKLNEQSRLLTWQASAVNIYQQAQDLIVKGQLNLNAQQYLTANLTLPHHAFLKPLAPQQPIKGTVNLYVQQIAPFLSAVTVIQNVQGLLHADLQITGTYSKPQILGSITLENARLDVAELNLQVRNIQLKAQGSPGGILNWKGQAQSGQGILYIKGNTALLQHDFPTQINLTGNNITVSNTEHYKITATPELQAKYNDKKLTVTGVIKLPSAHISLGTGSNEAVELSKDVVFVGANHKKATDDLPFYSQIQLVLGDDINLQYEGLTTQLRGQVLINDAPNHAVTGVGQIDFHQGNYTYYGQTLKIRDGSKINFNGAVDNPILNIQAIKTVEAVPSALNAATASTTSAPGAATNILPTNTNLSSTAVLPGQTMKIIVGVSVQGNIKTPEISLFSEPAILTQTDILSYLVVGQPSTELSSAGAGILFNAASSLNFGGTSQLKDVMQEVQKSVGVEFNIQSSSYLNPQTNQTQQNTSVVLAKALSPRIYVSYSVGILEALNTLQIRYLLSKYWTLQSTTSSLGNGVDLLYMIERGK